MALDPVTQLIRTIGESSPFSDSDIPSENDTLQKVGDNSTVNSIGGLVDINDISLVIKSGEKINLIDVYDGLFVEEGIFNTAISGYIRIKDGVGGLEKFMLRGGELLTIKISKPNNTGILIWREDLIVSRIGSGDYLPQTYGTSYNLYFYSRSYINSAKRNVFKSYKNQSLASAVVDIYGFMSSNDLFIEDPKITLQKPFICTGIAPHRAIDRLAQRSCSKDKYFVFFERFIPIYGTYSDAVPFSASHYFGSVDKIIEDGRNNPKIIAFTKKTTANKEPSYIRAINLKRKDNFNHIPSLLHGFYNTTITSINPITRTFTEQKLSYTDQNQSTKDFYANKLIDDTNIFANYDDLKNETPGRKVILSSINDSVARETWVKNHMFGEMSKTYFQIQFDIEGGTNQIGVGHVINFLLPSAFDETFNPTKRYSTFDRMYSGLYLVTKVAHSFRSGKYIKTIEASRGSSSMDMNLESVNYSSPEDFNLTESDIQELFGNRRTK